MSDTADTFGTVGNCPRLFSGGYLDLLDPQPSQFTIRDVACGLSKICRFGGQIGTWYSVAEHSILCWGVARQDGASVEAQLAVLLHDAAEAFLGDVVRPLKLLLPDYRAIEDRVQAAIEAKWGIDFQAHQDVIREIDRAMLIAEKRRFFPGEILWAGEGTVRVLIPCFMGLSHDLAEREFLRVFDRLSALSGVASRTGLMVGDRVVATRDIVQPPDDHFPGGVLARAGEVLVVRRVNPAGGHWDCHVSHEHRHDNSFGVKLDEIEKVIDSA